MCSEFNKTLTLQGFVIDLPLGDKCSHLRCETVYDILGKKK